MQVGHIIKSTLVDGTIFVELYGGSWGRPVHHGGDWGNIINAIGTEPDGIVIIGRTDEVKGKSQLVVGSGMLSHCGSWLLVLGLLLL